MTTPKPNALIENRRDFPVAGSIKNFKKDRADGWHYWISLEDPAASEHWPKLYVKNMHFRVRISDGGENVSPEPQPMNILLLRVDGATSQFFASWIENGKQVGYWQGISVNKSEIVANVPIFFP